MRCDTKRDWPSVWLMVAYGLFLFALAGMIATPILYFCTRP